MAGYGCTLPCLVCGVCDLRITWSFGLLVIGLGGLCGLYFIICYFTLVLFWFVCVRRFGKLLWDWFELGFEFG